MPRFFTTNINENTAIISGDDAKHISRVLRMKQGEEVTVCDMAGFDYKGKLACISPTEVTVDIECKYATFSEPSVKVRLFQAMPKADKFELIAMKAVELGVDEIIPVMTHRCVSKPDEKSMRKKLIRFNRITLEAAKQSGRGKVPEVLPLVSFDKALEMMNSSECPILFYENAEDSFKNVLSTHPKTISILVGSEGGFEPWEVEKAKEQGVKILSLGKRILRCETAPLAAISAIMYETDNM